MRLKAIDRFRSTYAQMDRGSAGLEDWRRWLNRVLIALSACALLPGMLISLPVFVAQRQYGVIAFDVALWLAFTIRLILKGGSFRFRVYVWLAIVFGMTTTYFVALGPHYARAGWLVAGAVMAAVFFGTRAALVYTALNAVMLMLVYWFIDPANPAWTSTLADSWLTWVMFVINVNILTLLAALPVGFLLDRLGRTLSREQEARHELSVESANTQGVMASLPGLFYMCDQGRLVRWNRRLEEVLGYSAEDLENLDASDLFAPESRGWAAVAAERATLEGQAEGEVLFVTKEGHKIPHYWVASKITVDGKANLVGMAIDINARLQAEAAVRESEARYRSLVENAPLGIVSCDLQGKIVDVNHTLLDILGSPSVAETREVNILTFFPLIEAGIAPRVQNCLLQGEESVSEHFYTSKWNRAVHVRLHLAPIRSTSGAITGAQGIVEDITARLLAEQKLQENELRYRALFERNNDGVFIFALDQTLLATNQQGADLLGYTVDELMGMPVAQMVVAEEYPDTKSRLVAMMAGEPVPIYERVFRRKDGSTLTAEVNVSLVRDEQGEPLHIHSIVRDITERKAAEDELERYRNQLEERVRERTTELNRAVNLMAGREVRMAELKDTIRQLHAQLLEAGLSPKSDDPHGTCDSETGSLDGAVEGDRVRVR